MPSGLSYHIGAGESKPVKTGVIGTAAQNGPSLLELRCVMDARIQPITFNISTMMCAATRNVVKITPREGGLN